MLVSLSIRNIVLIDQLDLSLGTGLGVLTGETGAGKSILLDALGLALGARAEATLVRHGADQASVTAAFELPPNHSLWERLQEQGLASDEEALVLRRLLTADGRSRAFVNDQPVSVGLLRSLGEQLVEVQGQFAQHGLLDANTHRQLLDAFGDLREMAAKVERAWQEWSEARAARARALAELERARHEEDFLRHALGELEKLDPREGEEEELAQERSLLMNAERLREALNQAAEEIAGEEGGAAAALARAQRALERVAQRAGQHIEPLLATLERAAAEVAEADAQLAALAADLELDPSRLEMVEERYFALKELARKHGCDVSELPALRDSFRARLAALDSGEEHLKLLQEKADEARKRYLEEARRLSELRIASARRMESAVQEELPPLRLDKARFFCRVEELAEEEWGPRGINRVAFEVATNPGTPSGSLAKVASGGELSRLLLALKVVLVAASPVTTLIFDEVDAGVGGATAAAVGERLARLADHLQVLVVTHSPQVAALGNYHWQVSKLEKQGVTLTRLRRLDAEARREEVARMLSGAEITDEARAAADRLMAKA